MALVKGTAEAVLEIASTVQELGNKWYRASVEWDAFPQKVSQLKRTYNFWEEQIGKYGLTSDNNLVAPLREAELLLNRERTTLSKRENRCAKGCFFKLYGTALPASVGESIERATKAFHDILVNLKDEEEAELVLQKRVRKQLSTLGFRPDGRYIPLEITETAVKSALEVKTPPDSDGPVVVLLYGGAGKGKSSLTRNVALHYRTTIAESSSSDHMASSAISPMGTTSMVFKQVIYLECGPQVDLLGKQLELRSQLGWDGALVEDQGGEERGAANSDKMVRKDLVGLLKLKKVLIILDDLGSQDREFLRGMFYLCGKNVRLLVTSRLADLLQPFTFNRTSICVPMETLSREDSQRLLAAHAGFASGVPIPDEVKVLMDDIIEKTEAHPHAMASVATTIHQEQPSNVGEWEKAVETLSELLNSQNTVFIHDKQYPHSFWQATKIKFDGLGRQENHLMVLMSMCKGPSVPEAVLELLYNRTKEYSFLSSQESASNSSRTFLQLTKGLEARQFLKVTESQITEDQVSWSVHSLDRQYIDETKDHEKKALFEIMKQQFSGAQSPLEIVREEPFHVINVVAALYFVDELATKIVSDLSIPLDDSLGSLDLNFRKFAIEPVTRFLVKNVQSMWPSLLQSSAQQVYKEGISNLLKSQVSGRAMLNALYQIVSTEVEISLGEEVIGAVLDLLEDKLNYPVAGYGNEPQGGSSRGRQLNVAQCDALATLAASCGFDDTLTIEILSFSEVIEGLAYAFAMSNDRNLQRRAARVLGILVANARPARNLCQDAILKSYFPTVVKDLVHSLAKTNSPDLQEAGAHVLSRLAAGGIDMKRKIMDFPGAVQSFIGVLAKDNNSELVRTEVARILATLTQQDYFASVKVFTVPGAVASLLNALKTDERSQSLPLPFFATQTLCNIIECICSSGTEELQLEVTTSEGLLEGISEAVMRSSETREMAAGALVFLDPGRGRELDLALCSGEAYTRRAWAEMTLDLEDDATRDLQEASKRRPDDLSVLSMLAFLRAKRGDLQGSLALLDRGSEFQPSDPFFLQERGILKRMMGDLEGALTDLDASLNIDPDDYEVLKHRGFVKLLLKDEEGARADAERALSVKPQRVDAPGYKDVCLGATSVEYLNYQLK